MLWMYHGHSAETADTYAGLVGPIIISNKGVTDKALGIDRCVSVKSDGATIRTEQVHVLSKYQRLLYHLHGLI